MRVAGRAARQHGVDAVGRCLRRGEHDVGQPLALQRSMLQLDRLVDQRADAGGELLLEGEEREQHADAEAAVHHQQRAEPDHRDALQPEQQPVQHGEQQFELARRDAGVHRVDDDVHEPRLPVVLAVEQLDRLHAAQRFEEVARLVRLVDDGFLGGVAQRPEEAAQRSSA